MPAYMIAGFPPHFAIGTNKLSAGMGTLVSTYRFGKSGNIPWKSAIPCVLMAVIGSAAGARIALLVSADLFKKIMLVIIPVTAYYVLKTKNLDIEREPLSQGKTIFRACLAALLIGLYDGFYGPGTGTFLILLLTSFARFTLGNANGTAKAIKPDYQYHLAGGLPDECQSHADTWTHSRGVRHNWQLHRGFILQREGRKSSQAYNDHSPDTVFHQSSHGNNIIAGRAPRLGCL